VRDDLYYDPYDYEIDRDPHPIWRRLRDEAPLYYNERFDFYAVSRFADVQEMSVDWHTYSSAYGSVLELIRNPEMLEAIRNMLFEDPPIHDIHRSILNRALTPRRVSDLEPRARQLCARFLDPLVGSGGFDFVQDFGVKIPMLVIGSLLGVPEEDQDMVRKLADDMLHVDEGESMTDMTPHLRMAEYMVGLVAERRKEPTGDFISALTHADIDTPDGGTRKLEDHELLNFITLIAAAGNETVARLMGWAGLTLARNPDQRDILLDDRSAIPGAVEELLRYEAPSPVQARRVMRDVEVHGQTVPEGAVMLLLTGSAGRDDRVYPDPDRFDVRRVPQHVSLGHGVHFCLGAALARLEGRIAIEEFLDRFPKWTVDEDRVEMVHTSTVRGPEKLPITV
jgi:cytochrome P450